MKNVWKVIKKVPKRIQNSLITAVGLVFINAIFILGIIVVPILVLFSDKWDKDLRNFYDK